MKREGTTSKAPLTESFARWGNLKIVLLALFGLTAGQAVVWYTGQFYTLFFLTQTLKVDSQTANLLIAGSLLLGTPFFLVFGILSDRIGRKPIIMGGLLLAALTYFPIFKAITHYANPALEAATQAAPVRVIAGESDCSVQWDPIGKSKFTSPCDVAKASLVKRGVPYTNQPNGGSGFGGVTVGQEHIQTVSSPSEKAADYSKRVDAEIGAALDAAKYPKKAEPASVNIVMLLVLLTILVIYVTMVYAPIAAMLVEMFPTRIRYTSMSLPYHIGNGWFGGFLPTTAFAIVAATGNIYSGLWYPVIIAVTTLVIGTLFINETKDVDISATS
jgi:MFS family permease